MNLRTWARVLIAVAFSISGLVETLSATGLVVELSPDGRWGPGVHTLAVSGPLQMVGAALLAFGHKTGWVARILGCYVFLASVFGNLPLVFDPNVGGSAMAGLLINLAVMGVALYWLTASRLPATHGHFTPIRFCDTGPPGCWSAIIHQVPSHLRRAGDRARRCAALPIARCVRTKDDRL